MKWTRELITMLLLMGTGQSLPAFEAIPITPAPVGSGLDTIKITPDGQTMLFVGEVDDGVSGDHLYRVPVGGGTATILSDPMLHNDVDEAPIADNAFAYFKGDQTIGNNANEWFQVPLAGGPQVQITNNTPFPNSGIEGDGFLINGGADLVFLNNSPDELFVVPTDGSQTMMRLSEEDIDIDQFAWGVTSDGTTAIYAGQPAGSDPKTFFSVATDGSGPITEIIPTGVADFFNIVDVAIMPDDSAIVFTAEQDFDGRQGLYQIPIGGGSIVPIVPLTNASQDIDTFAISPDGQMIAFNAVLEDGGSDALWIVHFDGGGLTNLTPSLPEFAGVDNGLSDIQWSPDGQQIYFLLDNVVDGQHTLFVANVPEPSSLILLLVGGLTFLRRRRRR